MNKRIYIAPEFEYVDMYLESLIMAASDPSIGSGDNPPGCGEVGDSGDIESKSWGGEWFDSDDYVE